MMRTILVCVGVLGIVGSTHTTATSSQDESDYPKPKVWTTVDLNEQDCRAFLKMTGRERDITVAFYHGVVAGMKKETIIDIPALAGATDRILDRCIDHPDDVLLKVFQEERK